MRNFHLFSEHHVTHGGTWSMSDYSAQLSEHNDSVALYCQQQKV